MHVFWFESWVTAIAVLALLAVKLWAFIDAVIRPSQGFPAADKLTKAAWLWITGLSLACQVVFPTPLHLLSLIGTVASFVYLLDVRPAVSSLTRRR